MICRLSILPGVYLCGRKERDGHKATNFTKQVTCADCLRRTQELRAKHRRTFE
jgi:hypothetical protein